MEALIDENELARQLNVSVQTVRRWRYSGEIEPVRLPGRIVRFQPRTVEELAAARADGDDIREPPRARTKAARRRTPMQNGSEPQHRELAPVRPLQPRRSQRFVPPVVREMREQRAAERRAQRNRNEG